MKANHIPTTFDDKLMQLDNTIAKMGGMAEVQLADAIDALLKRDANKAALVIEAGSKVDILKAEIDELPFKCWHLANRWSKIYVLLFRHSEPLVLLNVLGIMQKTSPSARSIFPNLPP